ncbi:putative DNA-binding protein escarola [Phtheirospermum japonicum]|uniref:AT-hook motif nuclear-localized protein n=1 Tax=Phtheirospermum japonicum TaxID=374723 RepID=A0A830DDX2_9LAMI|nr:putative DNA-binding protein escarola [Phtheirospermum japonicum]
MSGVQETAAVMTSREPFAAVSLTPAPASQPQLEQQMRVSYTAEGAYRSVGSPPPYQQMPGGAPVAMNLNSGDQKRKRGRPRKYGPDGNMSSMALVPAQQPINMGMPPQTQTFSSPTAPPPPQPQPGGSASSTVKKARGRPPGSSNKKKEIEAIGSTGIGFIPHVIDVKPGEDVSSKIMAFSQNGPRAVCILSANGAISNVTLRQAATSGGTATYEVFYPFPPLILPSLLILRVFFFFTYASYNLFKLLKMVIHINKLYVVF